ncbi:MAG: hypothetical protein AAB477_00895 [Patescibacteria group bacterium]
MKKNKNTLIGAGILALALIIAFVFAVKNKKAEAPLEVPTQSISTIEGQPRRVSRPTMMSDTVVDASYTETFMKYYDGNILQFDSNCQSHPTSLMIANGSRLLLDNRSNNSEVITIGENKYTLAPYNFQVITLNIPKIPTTFTVDCKVAQNVSTLTVE